MSLDVHFTDENWERLREDWTAWWKGELDRAIVLTGQKIVPNGVELPHAPGFTAQFPLEMPADEVIDRYEPHLAAQRWHGDNYPKWWPNFGPGVMAGFMGATVKVDERTVWFEPAERVEPADLHFEFDEENVWWRRVLELTATAVKRWDGKVAVAHTDLGGNLDILASFLTTERLLYYLVDCPDEIARLVGEITKLWIRYYDKLYQVIREARRGTTPWAAIWSPGRCYMMQSDFCYMISPAMFERFVLPDLTACCEMLDHPFYHLDGKGQLPHLDLLLGIEKLRGIQWIPGDGQPPPEQWPDVLKRIRAAGKLCQLYVTPEGALKIAREVGARGFVFHVGGEITAGQTAELQRAIERESGGR
jgi:5-methyltetrahydrofolate--homocysteine methyltransferase